MTTPRIDVAYRIVSGVNDKLGIDWTEDPAVPVVLTPGLYASASALATQIQSDLNSQLTAGSFTVATGSAGAFTISVGVGTFTIDWAAGGSGSSYSLRDWLGFSTNVASTSSVTGSRCPGVYVGTFPFEDTAIGWRWPLKQWRGHHQRGGALKRGNKVLHLEVNAQVDGPDRDAFTQVLGLMGRGLPATLYRDSTNTTAWSWSNYFGALVVSLESNGYQLTDWSDYEGGPCETRLRFAQTTLPSVSVTDFDTALEAPELGLRFYLYVQGIGSLFLDGEGFVSQLDSLWTAPTDKTSQSYVLRPHTLDTTDGLKDSGPEISRRSAEVSPGSMTLRLQEDRDGTLLSLFATELTDGAVANLTADLDHDTAGTGSVVTVDDTTNFGATGLAYLGRECIYYPVKSSTELGASGNKVTRDLFNDPNGTGTTYGDVEYVHNENRPQGPRIISDYPRVWMGRWVSLRAAIVDPFGRAYGTAYDGSWTAELWRGVIGEEPRPSDDWMRWELQCDDITRILDTEVGREPILGQLIRDLSGQKQSTATGGESFVPATQQSHFYLDEWTNRVTFHIREWTAANYPDGAVSGDITEEIELTTGTYSQSEFKELINDAFETKIAAMVTNGDIQEEHVVWFSPTAAKAPNEAGRWSFSFHSAAGSYYAEITMYWTAPRSAGPLMGFWGDSWFSNADGDWGGEGAHATDVQLAAYISPSAERIPFFYAPSSGLMETAPASGFARIGGDEGEVVEYSAITDKSSVIPGLWELTITKRGAMGTTPISHAITWGEDWTAHAAEARVEFGNGFDEVHPLTVLLRLGLSSGSGHHGTYDTLLRRTAPPLDPQHFDLTQIAAARDAWFDAPPIRAFLTKGKKLSELAAAMLAPWGRFLYAYRGEDSLYRIRVARMLPALESDEATTINSSNVRWFDSARWKGGLNRVVNHVEIKPVWDVLKEDHTDDLINQEQADSAQDYGTKGKLKWAPIGLARTVEEVAESAVSWAQQLFARTARPYLVLEVDTGRKGWSVRPGDVVEITLSAIPTQTGTRGLTAKRMVVLQTAHTYEGAIGADDETGSTLTVAVEPEVRHSTYSPAALIQSYNAATPSVTVNGSRLFATGDTAEDHFDPDDEVIIHDPGDYSTRDARTIVSVSGNVIVLDSALTNATGVDSVIQAQPYTAAQASQKVHVFLAPLTGAESFKYV